MVDDLSWLLWRGVELARAKEVQMNPNTVFGGKLYCLYMVKIIFYVDIETHLANPDSATGFGEES